MLEEGEEIFVPLLAADGDLRADAVLIFWPSSLVSCSIELCGVDDSVKSQILIKWTVNRQRIILIN